MLTPIDSRSADQLIVVEQANVLPDMMSTSKGTTRVSSDALTSGLVSRLVGANGLVGDAQRILGPASDARTRAAIRVVSPLCRMSCATEDLANRSALRHHAFRCGSACNFNQLISAKSRIFLASPPAARRTHHPRRAIHPQSTSCGRLHPMSAAPRMYQ